MCGHKKGPPGHRVRIPLAAHKGKCAAQSEGREGSHQSGNPVYSGDYRMPALVHKVGRSATAPPHKALAATQSHSCMLSHWYGSREGTPVQGGTPPGSNECHTEACAHRAFHRRTLYPHNGELIW